MRKNKNRRSSRQSLVLHGQYRARQCANVALTHRSSLHQLQRVLRLNGGQNGKWVLLRQLSEVILLKVHSAIRIAEVKLQQAEAGVLTRHPGAQAERLLTPLDIIRGQKLKLVRSESKFRGERREIPNENWRVVHYSFR